MVHDTPFIWTPDQPPDDRVSFLSLLRHGSPRRDDGRNRWYLFRREFELKVAPEKASVRITADGKFVLYVNGQQACRGPARCSPERQRVEKRSVESLLQPGINVLAVLVHVYGVDTGWYQSAKGPWQTIFGDGALLCMLEMNEDENPTYIRSDTHWRCTRATAWNEDTPQAGWGQDFIEDFDARLMPEGWDAAGFDDSDWDRAVIRRTEPTETDRRKGWGPVEPFPVLVESEIPAQIESRVAATAVSGLHGVIPEPLLAIDERIYRERLVDLSSGQIDNPAGLTASQDTTVRTSPGIDCAIVLKFDPMICGYPCIEITGHGGEIIEVAAGETIPGEYTGDLPSRPRLVRESYLDCAHVFRYTTRPGRQRFQKFDWTAIRYLMIVIRDAPAGVLIHFAGAVQTQYPVLEEGSFDCSDPFMGELWHIGRYTALQCTHDGWVDGPGREKRQWLGDGIVHYQVNAAAFGMSTDSVDRQFLIQAAESRRADGLLQMFFPGDHHEHSIVIPDFNFHWVMALRHYLMHTGNLGVVSGLYSTVESVLDWFALHANKNGLLADLPHWTFIEWANVRRDGESATINAMYVGALRAAAELAHHLEYSIAEKRHAQRAARVASALNERHWNPDRGLYADTVDPATGEQCNQVSQHANAGMILWDVAPRERWPLMAQKIGDRKRLRLTAAPPIVLEEQPLDPLRHMVRANAFFSFFVQEALAKAGRFDLALDLIRDFYRPILETGTSTLWESGEPHASTCHVFSAGPVYGLSAHVLGVQPVAPGFLEFLVAPQPAGLTSATGIYPSRFGGIEITWTLKAGRFNLAINVPMGTSARVMPPPGFAGDLCEALAPGKHDLTFHAENGGRT